MKWAKTKGEIEQIREKLLKLAAAEVPHQNKKVVDINKVVQNEIDQFYVELPEVVTIEYLKSNGFDTWLEVPTLPLHYKTTRNRGRYEAFAGGYLYYYDQHVKPDPKVERVLYFDWGKISPNAELTVYLNPCFKLDPKANKGEGVRNDDPDDGNSNGKDDTNKKDKPWEQKVEKIQRTVIATPPSAGITDPPPPPPPPPPPKE